MRFRDLLMTIATDCVALTKGVGADINHPSVISLKDEELMLKKGVFGVDSPAWLSTPSNFLYCRPSFLFVWWTRVPQFKAHPVYSCSSQWL